MSPRETDPQTGDMYRVECRRNFETGFGHEIVSVDEDGTKSNYLIHDTGNFMDNFCLFVKLQTAEPSSDYERSMSERFKLSKVDTVLEHIRQNKPNVYENLFIMANERLADMQILQMAADNPGFIDSAEYEAAQDRMNDESVQAIYKYWCSKAFDASMLISRKLPKLSTLRWLCTTSDSANSQAEIT